MKVVFLGTPSFAVPSLEAIYQKHQVLAVVCQPDKVGSRGKTEFSPVKKFALAHDLPLYQFEKISRDGVDILRELAPDIMVTAAYGQILSDEVISIAPHGIINVHGSLLPALRGAAPIQYAVWQGLTETGITILKTVKKVDAGDMILQKKLQILPYETNGELFERMAKLGAEAIVEALDEIENGTATFTPQDESQATFCKKITAEQEKIDWNLSAEQIINLVRALAPSPAAWTTYDGARLKIFGLKLCDKQFQGVAGEVVECGKKTLAVLCGDGNAVYVTKLQAENAKCLDIVSFLCGKKIPVGTVLGHE